MTMPNELLTPAIKKRITKDWQAAFPALGVYKPMHILKRHGPLLVGIALDRTITKGVYIPKFHVHNLLSPDSFISLSLIYVVPDKNYPQVKCEIKASKHEQDYIWAVNFLKHAMPELDSSSLTFSHFLEMSQDFIRQKRSYAVAKCCVGIFEDIVLLSFWCGWSDYAKSSLHDAVQIMQTWDWTFDSTSWQKKMEGLMDLDKLEKWLDQEIVKHKLGHLPDYGLIKDSPHAPTFAEVYRSVWECK